LPEIGSIQIIYLLTFVAVGVVVLYSRVPQGESQLPVLINLR